MPANKQTIAGMARSYKIVVPLLQVGLYCVTRCKLRHRNVDVCVVRLMAVGGQLPKPKIIQENLS